MKAVTVVGIGAEGWDGLTAVAQRALREAEVLLGSKRQLDLVPAEVAAQRVVWPSPMMPAVPGLLEAYSDCGLCVLASGDPMFYGIGSQIGPVRVITHPSSVSLACARLGWAVQDVEVISAVGRPVELVNAAVHPGRRVIVLSANGETPGQVAKLLTERGYGESRMTVLERLGDAAESHVAGIAEQWQGPSDPLNVIAIECHGSKLLPTVPGLPDDAYESDGQLTKREVRAITLSRLAPIPGQLLWDVGGGAGSIAIEWARTHPSCRAITIERDATRAARITRNAAELGVPRIKVVEAKAPVDGLEAPDAIFIGGGLTAPGMIEWAWEALKPGGRFVVNAVTVESEAVVARWHARLGGDLVRISITRGSPVGGFTGWRPLMPVTIWSVTKEDQP
ncbi:bifunctional cobalt-precorrin-7 (C(5))-methyltransferase/cobalt-precorrin-6B (C(15))-methyltransferase [Kibdelosporangium aridum]|uniref:Bifunctional cobalt-precorrin-7 (C(5))-methyltransferase/cobalt-precorrin-6B (C(15))-methyltransferase n=1 Tax=Kibdelosporangium aridum TaxID=2030 RepID=A0A428ZA64_KIBAR|nr:bifunctional cobalt-precorrin-7 (C(5))-methyltransferase/cobalt-precorrin-6B (C(15))-methyltransferase [Kibdelosporangium aridum]RSM84949.1 bifunctional cobalt-precorrin-7 (C(5))-methyltransferase/cobalt-precorrin-6B (C(15))-methyltransferase [Kibdelosporangium aridum]